MSLADFLTNLPEVKSPEEKRLSFNTKLKWTLIILLFFFVLSNIPLYGLSENALARFENLSIILGATFGSLMSLGIGPIVSASIVLQLLVGSKLIALDLTKSEHKRIFQGLQKILAIFFTIFEATIFVVMKGLQAHPGLEWLVIVQLSLAGILIIFMDEVVSKWGFGNGVGLFIVGGVAWQLFVRLFNFIGPEKTLQPIGKLAVLVISVVNADTIGAVSAFAAIAATILIFILAVYSQGIKVEVPLSFGRIRGFGIRWPLAFFYTNVIPVILTAALHANLQLFATLAERVVHHPTILGGFSPEGVATSGLAFWISAPPGGLIDYIIKGSFVPVMLWQSLIYTLFMVAGSVLFAVLWVKTSNLDAESQAQQISASGLQIPGFRRDNRVISAILSRYIMPLTIMGGAAVGLLAALTDITGALIRGTAILLAVMIIYKLYEEISQKHALDMHPIARKLMAV